MAVNGGDAGTKKGPNWLLRSRDNDEHDENGACHARRQRHGLPKAGDFEESAADARTGPRNLFLLIQTHHTTPRRLCPCTPLKF